MADIDPAWFYSSLAQSSAAIVGLIGAIFGSRIIDHLACMREERNELNRRIGTVYRQIMSNIQHWTDFRRYLEFELREDTAAIERGESRRRSREVMDWGMRGSGSEVSNLQEHKREMQGKLDVLLKLLPAYTPLMGPFHERDVIEYAQRLRRYANEAPERAKGLMLSDVETLEDIVSNYIRPFRARLLPKAFLAVFAVLVWIALTGIIWPLWALPGLRQGYPKSAMLAALFAYFGYQLVELRRLEQLRWVRIRPEDEDPRRRATARTLPV